MERRVTSRGSISRLSIRRRSCIPLPEVLNMLLSIHWQTTLPYGSCSIPPLGLSLLTPFGVLLAVCTVLCFLLLPLQELRALMQARRLTRSLRSSLLRSQQRSGVSSNYSSSLPRRRVRDRK